MKLSFLYCNSGACSEWRQGGARITGLSDFCVVRTLPVTTMLDPSGDRAVPASLYCKICVPMTLMVMVQ